MKAVPLVLRQEHIHSFVLVRSLGSRDKRILLSFRTCRAPLEERFIGAFIILRLRESYEVHIKFA